MDNEQYFLTIKNHAESVLVVKKSKFIANAIPVDTKDLADQYIEQLRKKYWDATHNVFAYSIGLKDEVQKFNDDGEPSGTAGKPVLETIKMNNVKNVLVVVTRYFGGVLLGASGLIRAYSESTDLALKEAGIVKRILCKEYKVTITYEFLGKLQWELRQRNLIVKKTKFDKDVSLHVLVPIFLKMDFPSLMLDITSGNVQVEIINEDYYSE